MVGIISNSAALFAQRNLEVASTQSELSIARLSSGNRIIRASDDVSGLAIGTVLGTTVSTLRTVLTSTSQAGSLLAIADGGLKNIGEILQRQKSLAVQANTGTLSDNERAFLQEEFSNLTSEINRIVDNTNFNGIQLLDGSIFDQADLTTNVSDALGEGSGKGSVATGTIVFSGVPTAGESVTINGFKIYFTAVGGGRNVQIGGSATATADNLVAFLNSTDIAELKEATYSNSSGTITVTHRQTGTIGNSFTLVDGATNMTVSGATLTGGANGDLEANATIGSATVTIGSSDVIGDSIITTVNTTAQAFATGTVTFTTGDATNANDTVTINGVVFTYVTAPDTTNELVSDASAANSGAQLAQAINASSNPLLAGLVASDDGAGVVTIKAIRPGTEGNAITLAESITNGTVSGGTLTGGAGSGVHVNNIVNNPNFVGTISGFEAEYVSSDKVNVSLTVGDFTYSAVIEDTTPGAVRFYRFYSTTNGVDGGGYFDIELAASQGVSVTNQSTADTFAARLDAAFSSLNFYQKRDVSNSAFVAAGSIYTGTTQTGSLSGASVDLKLSNFVGDNARVSSVRVEAPAAGASDGKITITLANGEVFQTASGLTDDLDDGSTTTLTSTTNPNHTIQLTVGTINLGGSGEAIKFENDSQAAAFQAALEEAFGLGEGQGGLSFQTGTTVSDSITVALASAATGDLYLDDDGVFSDLDIGTSAGAEIASSVLDNAINTVAALRATVGALQSRFDFASANITSSIQNTEAARSEFLDVDIADESTKFATSQVRLQASISVLAQANQIPQNLLKLIG